MDSFAIGVWLVLLGIVGVLALPLIIGVFVIGLQRPVMVVHKTSGLRKKAYVGFSWSYMLVGWWVPLVRGEIGIGALHFALTLFTFGLTQLIFCFLYNKQQLSRLLLAGWELDPSDPNYARACKIMNIQVL